MKLLTKEIEKKLPGLYETEKVPVEDKIIQVKFFNPFGRGTWYGVEYDPEDRLFFGFCELFEGEGEWGYFSLTELESISFGPGLGIERDLYFKPCKFSDLK